MTAITRTINSKGVVIVRRIGKEKGNQKVVCRCPDCGKEFTTWISTFYRNINSCRCKYPASKRLYEIWVNMKTRCYNPNCYEAKYYSLKNITVCDEWKDSIGVDNLNWSELPFNSIVMGEQSKNTDADRFKEITDKMSDTYKRKNSDYGNSFSKLFEECGMTYAYGHLAEKVERINSLRKNDAKVHGESMIDSLYDLANYSILTIMEIEKCKEHGTD